MRTTNAAAQANITRIASKRKIVNLPDTQEAVAPATQATWKPKSRIARIKSYFLEDNAISLNGRKYPPEAVDQLIRSAQLQLSDPNALPLTCYLSHEKADQDSTLDIAGKITSVGREGNKAYAMIDIPDTRTGREVATLVSGGYIRSQSLRASGAEMHMDKESSFPLVGGSHLKLEGIDYTSSPGLPQVARIAELVTESHGPQTLQEVFNAHPSAMLLEREKEPLHKEASMPTQVHEDGLTALTSGNSVGMDGDQTRDEYAQKNYPLPDVTTNDDTKPATLQDVYDAHDRLGFVMGMSCAPDTMEARKRFGNDIVRERKELREAGAKISSATKQHLMKAHDGIAKHLGLECKDGSAGNDGMQDGDDDDSQPPAKENKKMTPEEAAKLLAEAGYKVEAPKTPEQIAQEQFENRLAEQSKQFEAQMAEMKKLLKETAAQPQRKSLVEGATTEATPAANPATMRRATYIQEQIKSLDPHELIDRSRPLPEWMALDPERALPHYSNVLLGLMFDKFGYPD